LRFSLELRRSIVAQARPAWSSQKIRNRVLTPLLRRFVAANGDDSWSGKLIDPNAAKTDGPFASLQKARDAVRTLKKASGLPEGGITVFVRGGAYSLPQTLKLEAQDSGSPGAPVTYQACEDETPVVIGGKLISGFEPYRGKILKADVASEGLEGVEFGQLFGNGRRMHLARYPNLDPQRRGVTSTVSGKSPDARP
jgi:hypothetical protein